MTQSHQLCAELGSLAGMKTRLKWFLVLLVASSATLGRADVLLAWDSNGTLIQTEQHNWTVSLRSGRYGISQYHKRTGKDAPWVSYSEIHFASRRLLVQLPAIAVITIAFIAFRHLSFLELRWDVEDRKLAHMMPPNTEIGCKSSILRRAPLTTKMTFVPPRCWFRSPAARARKSVRRNSCRSRR